MRLQYPQPGLSISAYFFGAGSGHPHAVDGIISGSAWSCPRTAGRADQLNDADGGSEDSDDGEEGRDVLECIRLKPINNMPSVIIREDGFSAESKQTCNGQPNEESVSTYF